MGKSKEIKAYMGLVLVFMIWGSLYVVSQIVLESLPVFMVMFSRFIIAFAALSAIIAIRAAGQKNKSLGKPQTRKLDRAAWKYIILMGVLGYSISISLQLMGTKFAGASMASLINSINPVTISLMAVPILKEKLTGRMLAGIILSVLGVYVILGTGGSVSTIGIVLSIMSVLLWSLIAVLTRPGLSDYDPISVTRAAIGVAALCEIFFVIGEAVLTHPEYHIDISVVLCLLYLGIVCTGIAYIIWNYALVTLPASNCSALYPIQPLTSTAMGILIFHEALKVNFVIGTVCIIAGVLICILSPKRN